MVYTNFGHDFMFEYFNKDISYTSLCLVESANVLLCGTSRGSVCTHLWPPVIPEKELRDYGTNKVFREIEFAEFQPQLFPISLMAATPKDDSLITVSTDGMIFILKMDVIDKPDKSEHSNPTGGDTEDIGQTINELFLVKNSYIMQQMRAIRNKEMEVARYEKKKISDAENKHRENRAKLAKIEKLFEQSKNSSKDHQARFLLHSQETIKKQTKLKQDLADQLQEKVNEVEKETHTMVEYEKDRNAQLRAEFEAMKLEKKIFLEKTVNDQVETQTRLMEQFNNSLNELKRKYRTILEDAGKYGDVKLS